jgi:hypothetical protein
MTTSIRVDEIVRDSLRKYKENESLTYNGAILQLLEHEDADLTQKQSEEKQSQSNQSWKIIHGNVPMPVPSDFFREGVTGAAEFVEEIIAAITSKCMINGAARAAVFNLYDEMDIQPEVEDRVNDPVLPTLSDLISELNEQIMDSPTAQQSRHALKSKLSNGEIKSILQPLLVYYNIREEDEIPLENKMTPGLIVPNDRTYRAEMQDGDGIVTAYGQHIDPRPDLNQGMTSFSWGYKGKYPQVLATAILADAYPDRYACARSDAFAENFIIGRDIGASWELPASQLHTYLED